MQDKAECAGIELTVARSLDEIHQSDGAPIHFGLAGAYQRVNAALAVELATAWEERVVINSSRPQSQAAAARVAMLRSGRLPEAYQEGLRQCVWPGRAQVASDTFPAVASLAGSPGPYQYCCRFCAGALETV